MENGFSLIELFNLGGPFMWILLAFSVVTVAIIIERIIYISWHDRKVLPLGKEIMDLLNEGKMEDAEKLLSSYSRKQTAASIFLALLRNAKFGEMRMERAAEREAKERLRRMENGFNYLTALASLAPFTAFRGTDSGIIGELRQIANATDVNAQ
ncbi:MAG: MotA/TolQ/ExbB proton channel family protein, partial [Treponema sp.]|nr:MotA/TolQ/ExbB proton channel family protein [Candidatus Treponema equi]